MCKLRNIAIYVASHRTLKILVIRVIPWDFFLAFCQIEFSAEEQNAHAVVFE